MMNEIANANEPTKIKPISIRETLAILPSGKMSAPLTWDEVGAYLRVHMGKEEERLRNEVHALRDEMYRDGGDNYMCGIIERVFDDAVVKRKRKEWVPFAKFTNPLKRIINELSTVYAKAATRHVTNGDEKYQQLLRLVRMDEQMLQLNRLLNLHRALLVGFRVRLLPSGEREPVLDIATPANVRCVMSPNDDKCVVAWIVRTCYRPARTNPDVPIWNLWTDHERVGLRDDFTVITETYTEHKLGVCPWVPVTLGPPQSGFWPGSEGQDLVAARIAVWMQGVLMLKESKSATKQPVIQGDGTLVARGQAADSETPIELADGQSVTTVDMSMDLAMFRETSDHITEHAGLDYGMSPALMAHQGVQSAEARELMRQPLYEIRDQQQTPLRVFEHRLAIVEAAVLRVDLPALAFDPAGWEIQFGNEKLKLDPVKEQDLFEKRRAAGLTNSVDFLMELRPALDEEAAWAEIQNNVRVELARNVLMRQLQQVSGSMGAGTPDGGDPADPNAKPGATGAKPGAVPPEDPEDPDSNVLDPDEGAQESGA